VQSRRWAHSSVITTPSALWASHLGLRGIWAVAWPLQVDVFIAVGELALFVALADRWPPRSRLLAWSVTAAGLATTLAGNVGHIAGADLASRVTAAVPPLAAAAALTVGLGVLKRIVAASPAAPEPPALTMLTQVAAADSEHAARLALAASVTASNPISQRQMMTRFGFTRTGRPDSADESRGTF
jgi:hypothetical protein